MVNRHVKAKLASHVIASLWPTGHADSAGVKNPGDLADRRADCTACGGDHDGLSGLRSSDMRRPA